MFLRKALSPTEVVLEIHGPLSGETTAEFHRNLQEMASQSFETVTLDLTDVASINSSSLGKILLFRKKLAEGGKTLRIRGCSESLYKTLQMIKFDKLIPIERDSGGKAGAPAGP